ncbi:hypothetical protein KJ761_01690 [Patescibacteria group bacterium]|nr:hypothetical protein [Patescibacteria group bacterium]
MPEKKKKTIEMVEKKKLSKRLLDNLGWILVGLMVVVLLMIGYLVWLKATPVAKQEPSPIKQETAKIIVPPVAPATPPDMRVGTLFVKDVKVEKDLEVPKIKVTKKITTPKIKVEKKITTPKIVVKEEIATPKVVAEKVETKLFTADKTTTDLFEAKKTTTDLLEAKKVTTPLLEADKVTTKLFEAEVTRTKRFEIEKATKVGKKTSAKSAPCLDDCSSGNIWDPRDHPRQPLPGQVSKRIF